MFKFLRKYNKIILAVGGTLLMIVFLIPQAIQGLSQRAALSSTEVATVGLDNEEVSVVRWSQVQEELQVIDKLGIQIRPLGRINTPEQWFLLTREAEQAGLIAPKPAAEHGINDENLRAMRQATGLGPGAVLRTLSNADGVQRLVSLYVQSGELSDKRLMSYLQRLFHGVGIETVALVADPEKTDFTPTEQQIAEQFEKYKDQLPGEGDYGFGYKLPDRVKLEWLNIPAADARALVENTDAMGNRELRRHWRENENQRGIPPVDAGADVPAIVREDLLTQLSAQKLDQIEKFAYDQIRIPQRNLERAGGFFVLPDDWNERKLQFGTLADEIQSRFGVRPEYHAAGAEWTETGKLLELKGIGEAATDRFAGAASNLAEFVSIAKELGGDGGIPIQKNLSGPPLKAADGSRYLFRIADISPAHAPADVAEVRDQIVEDLKREAAYEQLKARFAEIERAAIDNGLLSLAMQNDTELNSAAHVALYSPDRFYIHNIMMQQGQGGGLEAIPSPVPGAGENEALLEEIINWALALPRDSKIADLPEDQKTKVFPVDDQLMLLAVRLTRQLPLTEEDYRQLLVRNRVEGLLVTEELNGIEDVRNAFSVETMSERHNFELHTRDTEEGEDAAADDSKTVADAGA